MSENISWPTLDMSGSIPYPGGWGRLKMKEDSQPPLLYSLPDWDGLSRLVPPPHHDGQTPMKPEPKAFPPGLVVHVVLSMTASIPELQCLTRGLRPGTACATVSYK